MMIVNREALEEFLSRYPRLVSARWGILDNFGIVIRLEHYPSTPAWAIALTITLIMLVIMAVVS